LLPLLPFFEFELMVLENAGNNLILAFRDVNTPPVLTCSKLTDNRAELDSEVVFLGFGLEKTSLNSVNG
jgi:hypothetical protein